MPPPPHTKPENVLKVSSHVSSHMLIQKCLAFQQTTNLYLYIASTRTYRGRPVLGRADNNVRACYLQKVSKQPDHFS